jgi:hypothetical protein
LQPEANSAAADAGEPPQRVHLELQRRKGISLRRLLQDLHRHRLVTRRHAGADVMKLFSPSLRQNQLECSFEQICLRIV